ncbi:UDP-N-acetylglucosamine transferase subunit ALG13 [Bradyrhizobium sp. Rc2d]|uniref:glycosyltransferase n=1 Tax=Bradyrhizobium sp. Rc2d TaxID=1855321 RepID=UPI00087E029E|nr:glycosyltransferase [Bradyrhizobium sp. Rc2d]SDG37683.1 UDP-N-acetylglucosamine transferase subunit ALG13 [Bradyrhizobium sp. Rc2d]
MIFVTVGSMMAFDRLILSMDKWALAHADGEVLAQIGGGAYRPSHMRWTRMLSPSKFQEAVSNAAVLVAHAGMGSYFVAAKMRKPIVMLPRLAMNREHTTDHQLHTIKWLRDKPGVYAAMSDDELDSAIEKAMAGGHVADADFANFAPEPFLMRVRQFLVN